VAKAPNAQPINPTTSAPMARWLFCFDAPAIFLEKARFLTINGSFDAI
jgi:hypothetical protein